MSRSITTRIAPARRLAVDSGMHSVAGKRAENEDRVALHDTAHEVIALLADGMGGGAIGATMSDQAVHIAREALQDDTDAAPRLRLERAFQLANQALLNLSRVSPRYRESGSTLVAVLLQLGQGDAIAHVAKLGDSRVYVRAASGELRQIGRDHTYGEELHGRGASLSGAVRGADALTYALGEELSIEGVNDFYHAVPLRPGDALLLCSDGLSAFVSHEDIGNLLGKGSAQHTAEQLVRRALLNGSDDNISALVLRCGQPARLKSLYGLRTLVTALVLLVALAGATVWAGPLLRQGGEEQVAPAWPIAATVTSVASPLPMATTTFPASDPTSTRVPIVRPSPTVAPTIPFTARPQQRPPQTQSASATALPSPNIDPPMAPSLVPELPPMTPSVSAPPEASPTVFVTETSEAAPPEPTDVPIPEPPDLFVTVEAPIISVEPPAPTQSPDTTPPTETIAPIP